MMLYASDTSKLLDAKKEAKAVQKTPKQLLKKGYIQIIYHNWSALDVLELRRRYKITPVYGIADGVIVFYYDGDENIFDLIERIKREQKEIEDIRIYKKNRFSAF